MEGVLSGTQPASLRSYSRGSYNPCSTVRSLVVAARAEARQWLAATVPRELNCDPDTLSHPARWHEIRTKAEAAGFDNQISWPGGRGRGSKRASCEARGFDSHRGHDFLSSSPHSPGIRVAERHAPHCVQLGRQTCGREEPVSVCGSVMGWVTCCAQGGQVFAPDNFFCS